MVLRRNRAVIYMYFYRFVFFLHQALEIIQMKILVIKYFRIRANCENNINFFFVLSIRDIPRFTI